MIAKEIKSEIVHFCHRMYERGYVAAYEGNVSARIDADTIVVTPTQVCKGDLAELDLVTVDPNGVRTSGKRQPTSELKMHLMVYRERPDIQAVVHAHPPVATGFAAAGREMPERVLPEAVVSLGRVPLVEYGTPSTHELPDRIRPHILGANAFLLANHGVLCLGSTIDEAYYRLETLEQYARVVMVAQMAGGPKSLTKEQTKALLGLTEELKE